MATKRTYEARERQEELSGQLQQLQNAKPGAYESKWTRQIEEALGKVLNREDFSYELNEDAFYQRYRDLYQRQGRQAMRDVYGQSAAMTGGYGNSYAQTAAQQAYAGQLQQLQERIPELYSLALERYRLGGENLQQKLNILQQQEKGSYDRYRDDMAAWQSEHKRLLDLYADARDQAYREQRDQINDDQWLAEFEEAIRQFDTRYRR